MGCKTSKDDKPIPTNLIIFSSKEEAKRKFKVYPSAYANGWLVRTYKKRGGHYRGLDRWFEEEVDIKTGKPCGRQKEKQSLSSL